MRGVIASIRERFANHIDATIPIEAGTSQYRITAASTLDDAHNGTASTLFDIPAGGFFASASVKSKKHHTNLPSGAGRDRKVTRMVWDPMDYYDPTEPTLEEVPEDGDVLFMRVQRYLDAADAFVNDGPINIVLPQSSLSVSRPLLTLHGTAPNVAATAGEKALPTAMHFHLPLHSAGFVLRNHDDTNPMFVSFAKGHPLVQVDPETSLSFPNANIAEVLIAGGGNQVSFSMVLTLQNGL